mmetsp:Transcript_102006/g.181177  ORF Transcript_102006/g.181177 Transcript_102006/m.181177 type:complete len:226 (+) Transcript_102006:708-1385(+)
MQYAVFCEGARPHEMVEGLPLVCIAGLPIRFHHTFSGEGPYRSAEIDFRSFAKLAAATVCLVARNDMVSRLVICDTLAHAFHHASCLMSQDARKESFRITPPQGIGVGVAQRYCRSLDANFSGLRRTHGDLHQFQRLFGLECHSCHALDLLPRSSSKLSWGIVRGENRSRGQLAWRRAPLQEPCEVGRVIAEMVPHEGGDEEIGVVVAQLHPQREGHALLVAGCL